MTYRFSKLLNPPAFLPATYESSSCPMSLLIFDIVSLYNFSHFIGMYWYLILVLFCNPLMAWDLNIFSCVYWLFINYRILGNVSSLIDRFHWFVWKTWPLVWLFSIFYFTDFRSVLFSSLYTYFGLTSFFFSKEKVDKFDFTIFFLKSCLAKILWISQNTTVKLW